MPNAKYGFDGTIYFNGGTYGSPTWGLVNAVRDVNIGADMDETDASTRIGGGVKQSEPTLLAIELSGKIRSNDADSNGFILMETAFFTRTSLDVLFLDNPNTVNGSRGYRCDMKVFKFGEPQNLGDVLFREFSIKPCASANAVNKAVVSGGAPTFSTLAM